MGAALPDSLGRTYPSHLEAVQEYCNRPRNEALQVENYADFDVWDVPPDASAALAEQIVFVRRFFKTKEWAKAADLVTTVDTKTLISPHRHVIGVVSSFDASTWLYFDGMTDRLRQSLLFIPFNADAANLQSHLSRCDAVIVVRDLLTQRAGWIVKVCHLMKIPLYYLIDDNFIVLRDEVPELAAYTMDSVRAALAGFAAVICTSAALVEWFRRFHLHPTIMQFSASFDAQRFAKMQSVPRQRSDEIRVGFVGGLFRRRNLDEDVLPALASLHNDSPVAFFSHTPPEGPQPSSFATTVVARTGSYDAFLMRWRAAGLDLLVHPRGETKNAPYKTDSILLTALYLGAVPIVAAEGAFRDIGEEQGVLKVDGGRTEWERALRRAQDVSVRQRLMSRLDAFCRSHFTPERTAAVLENIFATWPPTDILTLHNRARDALSSANTAQVVELEDRLLAMRKSISWKITAPVREIQRFFRRLGVR
jgi:glycosyltransferase involved in cell wall biosynthesis